MPPKSNAASAPSNPPQPAPMSGAALVRHHMTITGTGAAARAVCNLCTTHPIPGGGGGVHSCVTWHAGVDPTDGHGRNATTALRHLKRHGVTPSSPNPPGVQTVTTNVPTDAETNAFVKVCVEHGVGYKIFRDTRFTHYQRRALSSEVFVSILADASAQTLKYMGKILREAGSEVSIVFDLGTIDRIQTLNVLVVSTKLGRDFMLASLPVYDSSGKGIAVLMTSKVLKRFRKYSHATITGFVCDNGPNMLAACKLLREHPKYASAFYSNCACHIFNLVGFDIDEYLVKELGLEGVYKWLFGNKIISRIPPTRWWARHLAFCRVTRSANKKGLIITRCASKTAIAPPETLSAAEKCEFIKAEKSRVEGNNWAAHVIQGLEQYVQRTNPLFTVARILEANRSTVPMALRSYLFFINDDTDSARQYFVLNRCLKFLAGHEVFVAEAALTGLVLPSMGRMGQVGAFKLPLTAILLPKLRVIGSTETTLLAHEVVDSWKLFVEGSPKEHSHFRDAPQIRDFHYVEAPAGLLPLKLLYDRLGHVVASETASERSLSLQKGIRSKRFSLHPERCELEVTLAHNDLPPEQAPTTQIAPRPPVQDDNSLQSFSTESDTDEEDRMPKRPRTESTTAQATPERERTLAHLITALTTGPLPPLPVDYGVQMLMMWYWRTAQWDKMKVGSAVAWKPDPSTLNKSLTVVKSINRRTFVLKLRSGASGERVFSMGLAAAFIHCVQLVGSVFEWPARPIVIDTKPFVEERVNLDVDPQYGVLDDLDGIDRPVYTSVREESDNSVGNSSGSDSLPSSSDNEEDTDAESVETQHDLPLWDSNDNDNDNDDLPHWDGNDNDNDNNEKSGPAAE